MRRTFRKYGEIDSILVRESSRKEAYVTFISDRTAYLVLLAASTQKEISIKIAYTWNQPKQQMKDNASVDEQLESVDPTMLSLLDLNDDCFFALFDYCDNQSLVNLSETNKRFDNLLKVYHFPRIDNRFQILIACGKIYTTPIEVRKMLRLMGKHFTELYLIMMKPKDMTNERFDSLLQWYFKQVVKYSPNIEKAHIETSSPFQESSTQLLTSMFNNLHSLELDTGRTGIDADLSQLCPKLKNLKIYELSDETLLKPFPTLENLDTCADARFLNFFSHNPQIKRLKLDYGSVKNNLDSIVNFLPNIDELTVLFTFSGEILDSISLLKSLENLTKLTLRCVRLEWLEKIAMLLNGLSLSLLEIEFHCKFGGRQILYEAKRTNIQQLIAIASKVHVLKLKYIKFTEDNVFDLIQSLPNLKSLYFYRCEVTPTDSLITDIVNARKLKRQQRLELHTDNYDPSMLKNYGDAQCYLEIKQYQNV